jgi:hypothetical protein
MPGSHNRTLAPAYKRKKVQEESEYFRSETKTLIWVGNAAKQTGSPQVLRFRLVFFQLWTEEEEEVDGGLRLQPQGLQQQKPST